ncbi:unnamed protein product [Bathycoccus prasinos]
MRACTSNLAFVCAARRASTSYASTTTSASTSSRTSPSCRGRSKTSVRTVAFSSSSSSSSTTTSSSSSSPAAPPPLVNNKTNQNNNNNNNNNNNSNIRRSSKVVANARKGMLFNSEMDDIRRDAKPAEPVKFTLPLSIKLYPSKCLRVENEPVTVFDDNLKELSKEMFKIMYETVGCGLAAPQVGVNYRLMVYNEAGAPGEGKEVVLVNPKISKFSKQKDFFEEGCLSFPKIYAEVERPMGVKIEAQDVEGNKFKMTLEGFEARVFQHEYDHLDGVLFHDRMSSSVVGDIRSDLDKLIEDFSDDEKAI